MLELARLAVSLLLLGCLWAGNSSAQLKGFPWINRADPKVDSFVFLHAPQFRLNCKEVGVYPFSVPEQGEPQPPEFATFLRQALLMQGLAESIADVASLPWDELPDWTAQRLSGTEKIAAVAEDGDKRRLDLAVLGTVDVLFRKPSGGLVARVTIQVIDTRTGDVVWYGAKRADWLRHFPLEDCLLHVAGRFVEDWQ